MSALALAPGAFLAGILMFLAPCTLPIVPAYLAFIAGAKESDARDPGSGRAVRRRIFLNAIAFVIGFSIIFILFGTFAAYLGSHLGVWRYVLARLSGVLLILFGITMLGVVRIPVLSSEGRIRVPKSLTLGTIESSLLIGGLFALGWSPCIGPILGSILFLASASATALQGAVLLAVFSLGLAIPFLLCAALIGEASSYARRLGPLSQTLQAVGGIILIGLGVLMLGNNMGLLIAWGYRLFGFLGYDRLLNFL